MTKKLNGGEKNNIKSRQWICIVLILWVLVFAVAGICYFIVHGGEHDNYVYGDVDDEIANLEKREVVIVPGAAVEDGNIGAIAKDRLNMAVRLYNQKIADVIIVSGSSAEETSIMATYLMEDDVAAEDILADDYGTNTYATVSRIKEKYGTSSCYFCTQEMYSDRACYLMNKVGLDGQVICVDTMYYNLSKKAVIREVLAATKAVFEPVLRGKRPKISLNAKDLRKIETVDIEKKQNSILAEEAEVPKDCVTEDINPNDEYDVNKAVEYARKYSFEANKNYALFELNCTNFVSQCLLEGGISAEGEGEISAKNKYQIKKTGSDWYSVSEINKKTGKIHYSTTYNFINTDKFIEYFTNTRGYKYTIYKNDYEGKLKCYNDIASGDVLIFYGMSGEVEHLGIVTGKGDMNAYYCSNTNPRRDYGVFTINDDEYPKMGILHMSEKQQKED